MLKVISLLHVVHEFLHVYLKGKSTISVESFEEIITEIPPVPGNVGATFLSPLCAEVKLITSFTFQKEGARDFLWAVW